MKVSCECVRMSSRGSRGKRRNVSSSFCASGVVCFSIWTVFPFLCLVARPLLMSLSVVFDADAGETCNFLERVVTVVGRCLKACISFFESIYVNYMLKLIYIIFLLVYFLGMKELQERCRIIRGQVLLLLVKRGWVVIAHGTDSGCDASFISKKKNRKHNH